VGALRFLSARTSQDARYGDSASQQGGLIIKIQVNTGHNLEGTEALALWVEAEVRSALERFDDRLTRVEVHLGDESGDKDGGGADKRCLLEARPAGMQPVVVTDFADTVEKAIAGATQKMQSLLNSTFGRIDGHDSDATIRQNEST
jgi:ribosome-associated translation inhibitor RaiA